MIISNEALSAVARAGKGDEELIAAMKQAEKISVVIFGRAAVERQKAREAEYNTQIRLLAEEAESSLKQVIANIEESMKGKWSVTVKNHVSTHAHKFSELPLG